VAIFVPVPDVASGWAATSITSRKRKREAVEMIELWNRMLEKDWEKLRGVGVSPGSYLMFMILGIQEKSQ
jgi:hypothetical protein